MKINVKGPIVDNMTGWLYDYLGMDSCYPKQLAAALAEAGGEDVILEINSNGGLCFSGFEMYKQLTDYEGKITAHVTAACSAATFLACAADETLMSDAAIYMIHNTQGLAMGDYRDMDIESAALKEFNQSIINIYQKKTGMEADELQKMMDSDTYMSPQKAIELGFADGWIYGEPKASTEPIMAVAAVEQIISPKIAEELFMKLNGIETGTEEAENGGNVFQNNDTINPGVTSDATDDSETGGNAMNLEEFLAANPEAQAELDQRIEAATKDAVDAAREEGVTAERERIKELDEIAHGVTAEALADAKYGDVCDAKELSFRAMKDEKLRMASYMAEAISDSLEADAIAAEPKDEDDATPAKEDAAMLAGIVNQKKEGK